MIIVANTGTGRLYVVATPIGNLGDMSPRAREILLGCTLVAAEDTRHSALLMRHFAIATPMVSLHEHNEVERAAELIERMKSGASIALISDAGTPAISDPGYALVCAAAAAGIEILAVPGPCAAVAALSVAALPTARFCFEGFLPARDAARRTRLQELEGEERTLVFYESPHRLAETLHDCAEIFGAERSAVVARELTKMHECVYRGTLAALVVQARQEKDFTRGEIVLLIGGASIQPAAGTGAELDRVLRILLEQLPLKQAAGLAAQITGTRDNEAYKRALQLKATPTSQ
jgi:16S rRNA (cytidine1402-2'-O)-methyltransferase